MDRALGDPDVDDDAVASCREIVTTNGALASVETLIRAGHDAADRPPCAAFRSRPGSALCELAACGGATGSLTMRLRAWSCCSTATCGSTTTLRCHGAARHGRRASSRCSCSTSTLTAQSPNRTAFLLDAPPRPRGRSCMTGAANWSSLAVIRSTRRMRIARPARRERGVRVRRRDAVRPTATQERLAVACETQRLALRAGVRASPSSRQSSLRPAGGDHYRVFTPYWRAWQRAPRRASARGTATRPGPGATRRPVRSRHLVSSPIGSPRRDLPSGGETAMRRQHLRTLDPARARSATATCHDDLAGDATSRLSPSLHFGCISPLELVERSQRPGGR